jgi:flagellar basal body-associated protein FliL
MVGGAVVLAMGCTEDKRRSPWVLLAPPLALGALVRCVLPFIMRKKKTDEEEKEEMRMSAGVETGGEEVP